MVACFRPSLSWTYVIELAFTNHDKTLAVKEGTPYYKKNLHSARVNKSSNSQKSKKERKNL